MTEICAEWRENRFSLSVSGHAGHSANGNDIVCAGVSMLVHALAAWMAAQQKAGLADIHTLTCEKGCAVMDVRFPPPAAEPARGAASVVLEGFRLLAVQYPQNVRFAARKPQ